MRSRKAIRIIVVFFIVIFNVSCDQISKAVVRERIGEDEEIVLIANHFILTKVENTGAFLSAGNSLPHAVKTIFLSVLPMLALAYGLFFVFTKENLSGAITMGLCFFIGGGIGNIYDRIVHGSVTDFLHIDFVLFQTGIFNMADVSIMAGMLMILVTAFRQEEFIP